VKYRCRECGAVYNLFTGTLWSGTHYDCKTIVVVLRGIAQGVSTLHLAEELDLDYSTLLDRRHQIQRQALEGAQTGLPDRRVEADEMYQNAGEKAEGKKLIRILTPTIRPAEGQTSGAAGAPTKTTVRRRSG
jgi:hypothetical protein